MQVAKWIGALCAPPNVLAVYLADVFHYSDLSSVFSLNFEELAPCCIYKNIHHITIFRRPQICKLASCPLVQIMH